MGRQNIHGGSAKIKTPSNEIAQSVEEVNKSAASVGAYCACATQIQFKC